MKNNLKTAVIGAGAIGGITAALLTRAGHDVEVVCKYEEIVKKAEDGIEITGVYGDMTIPVKAIKTINELSGKKDVIIIATKAYDMPEACENALNFSTKDTLFISMQNGICIDAMADVVGKASMHFLILQC